MTITYQFSVATATFCGFAKLLAKWKGSIYKLVYKEMLVYAACYTIISLAYRLAMNKEQRRMFEKVSLYCEKCLGLIPLSFVLGFYVTFVVQRWWSQFTTIPWPDRAMNTVNMYVEGTDERGRLIRRTLMRYLNLSFVLILRTVSVSVMKRFPTFEHLVEAGFMTVEETHMITRVNAKINKYWIPMSWFVNLVHEARKEGRIEEGSAVKHILEELNKFRSKTSLLWCYDWVTVPIVYTQVVTWATHIFFLVCVIGRQYLDPVMNYHDHDIDMYVPFFTLLQFFFYMGWLKVAEQLINPFGEDEDDFETNWLIDRNLQVSYIGVDELHGKLPQMEKDIYWDDAQPDLPYTQATLIHKIPSYCGSTMHLRIPDHKQLLIHQPIPLPRVEDVKQPSLFSKLKKQNHAKGKSKMKWWKKMKSLQFSNPFNRNETPRMRTRTLGRRESLLGGELLAMLNRGKHKHDTPTLSVVPKMFGFVHEIHPMEPPPISIEISVPESPPSTPQHPLLPNPRRENPFRRESSDSSSSVDRDNEPIRMNLDMQLSIVKPHRTSVFGEGHQPLLARLSEIENENDVESIHNVPASLSYSSLYQAVVNPEIGKKLMSHNCSDSDNEF